MRTAKKVKKKSSKNTIITMIIIALVVLVGYYYITVDKPKDTEETKNANRQVEEILKIDFTKDYPEESKEVVELFSKITQSLYSDIEDDAVQELGERIRNLYDDEFLEKNPEEKYLNELLTNIATWRDKNRKITKYIVLDTEGSKSSVIDGVEYQVEYVSFTFQEEAKASQTWRFLLRKNELNQWKIVGWEAAQ